MEQTNVTPGNKNFLSRRPLDFWPVLTLAADVTVVLKPTKNCTEFLGIQLVVRSSTPNALRLSVRRSSPEGQASGCDSARGQETRPFADSSGGHNQGHHRGAEDH
ncbi:uncharacterized protein LOC120423514 isoform X1 [Culex pipiens pallens]|uniref:uncharacterized protein LOC120423514 isoform X1 n=1 Tax=Culex pipiens pallens TaxID=42434 RepID=UPI001953D3B1|nr:uncharacterized protein LOC120423514 isoform X1 [Culex pipiens pallens]